MGREIDECKETHEGRRHVIGNKRLNVSASVSLAPMILQKSESTQDGTSLPPTSDEEV